MKKINILLITLGLLIAVSCDSDRDSNPTLADPTEFVLNVPPYASSVYELEKSSALEFTCSQPDYGFTAPVDYVVQISLTGDFKDAEGDEEASYITLPSVYNTATIAVGAQEFAVGIVDLSGISSEEDFYTEPIKVYVRLKASITVGGLKPIVSNVIELPKVLAYFAVDPLDMPANMYMIGSFNSWNWAGAYPMVPVYDKPGKFWRVVYFEDNAELKFNSNKAWDGGDFGYNGPELIDNASADLEETGGNIKIKNGGWYLVVVSTTIVGLEYQYAIEFLEPNVYLNGAVAGEWNVFDETRLFTVPATADGEFVSPAFIANADESNDGLRICVKLEGSEWWHTEFIILEGVIEYRGADGDQERVAVTAGEKAYLNFTAGTGYIK